MRFLTLNMAKAFVHKLEIQVFRAFIQSHKGLANIVFVVKTGARRTRTVGEGSHLPLV